jgi:hypothetical protein
MLYRTGVSGTLCKRTYINTPQKRHNVERRFNEWAALCKSDRSAGIAISAVQRAQPQGMASPSGTVFIIQGDREYGINQTLRDWN